MPTEGFEFGAFRLDSQSGMLFREGEHRAYREHNPDLIELTREPSFTGLHSNAKFLELARRIGWSALA